MTESAAAIAARVEAFVRDTVAPYERDPRCGAHGPSDDLVAELRAKAREANVLTPHIRTDGSHLHHRAVALVLRASGLSPLGPIAVNVAAPDEGNMYLLGKVASPEQRARFLDPMIAGEARSAFFMTEPASEGGAGSDPSMMQTTARQDGNHWVIDGRKAFITGADGAKVGIVMAKSPEGASMFLVDLPDPAIRIERTLDTIDSSMPGGHAVVAIENLRVTADQMLGNPGDGFRLAQIRLAPARLTHCMRWLGACIRAHEIATDYACRRHAFGKPLVDHEGVGFMLAENLIDLKQAELMIDWCAGVLDTGELGTVESSMAKVAVSEALMRIADRCVQVMGGTGVTGDTIVAQVFREVRAFRIYDGPTEVHKWSLAKKIKRDWREARNTPMEFDAVVLGRRSIRGYKPDPVPRELIEEIIALAMRAPSSMNTQPWHFHVLTGEPLARIRAGNTERMLAGVPQSREFRTGQPFAGPHRDRQIGVAKQLFSAMGIDRDDKDRRQDWVMRGFRQFDAPVCVIITYDRALDGSDDTPFDCGAAATMLVNAAWSRGLGAVINSQGIMQSPVVREHARIPDDQVIMKSIALGWPDDDFPANAVVSERRSVDEAAVFVGFGEAE